VSASHILALDQGTTSTRSIVFDKMARPVSMTQREFAQHYPKPAWVEHDPEDIWRDAVATMRDAIAKAKLKPAAIAALGITNQRETVVVWERASGKPIYNAIVWQDRRTAEACAKLRAQGAENLVRERTGLLLDPYFSGTKLAWILDHVSGARAAAEKGALAFGTIDSFLLWRLTGGKVHATDATNAARTLLFDIHLQDWDSDLLRLLNIPRAMLPEVKDNSGEFGIAGKDILGASIPITGMAGDQQAALFGQACFARGMAKSTYGTGCFMLMNIGETPVISQNRLLTTPAFRLQGRTHYALEGSIFVAGAAVKWLRDGLGIIAHASQTNDLATSVADNHGIYMVPGFVGLGAPHWNPDARGLICGLTLDAKPAHLARAALEAVAYQTLDLTEAMRADGAGSAAALRLDGGMAANDWFCQFLADILDAPVERPQGVETTAQGAAFLAGLAVELWPSLAALSAMWKAERRFVPRMEGSARTKLIAGWQDALRRTLLARA
jgi:glycerol kinase